MNRNNSYITLIEKYLDNMLQGTELLKFEEQLKIDKKLQREVAMHKDINKAIVKNDLEEFKTQIKSVRNAMLYNLVNKSIKKSSKQKFIPRGFPHIWLYAASVILLIGISAAIFFSTERHYSNKQLYAIYFTTYQAGSVERSSNSSDSLFDKAMEAYKHNNFNNAITSLHTIIKYKPNNLAARLYLGISYLEMGYEKNATLQFSRIIDTNDPVFKEPAQWYLCLTYLKQNIEKQKINRLLQQIINEKGDYYKRAKELLKKMKR